MPSESLDKPSMLFDLLEQVKTAVAFASLHDMRIPLSESDLESLKKDHPGAHLVVGCFEIKCLEPEKYNL